MHFPLLSKKRKCELCSLLCVQLNLYRSIKLFYLAFLTKQLLHVTKFCFYSQQPFMVKGHFSCKSPRLLQWAMGPLSSVFLLWHCFHRKTVWGRISYWNENPWSTEIWHEVSKPQAIIHAKREKLMEMSLSPIHWTWFIVWVKVCVHRHKVLFLSLEENNIFSISNLISSYSASKARKCTVKWSLSDAQNAVCNSIIL